MAHVLSPYRVQIHDRFDDNDPVTCSDCDWDGTVDQVDDIKHATLTPGDASPVGRCPKCESLAYVVTEQTKLIAVAPMLLAACRAAIEATGGSAFWNGETKAFLELAEAAIAAAE
jgi:hypothetical protein